jgi:thioredoxin reductase
VILRWIVARSAAKLALRHASRTTSASRHESPAPGAERDSKGGPFALRRASVEHISARSVVIATGARYRRLTSPDLDAVEGTSVQYWASPLEGKLCAGQEPWLKRALRTQKSTLLRLVFCLMPVTRWGVPG